MIVTSYFQGNGGKKSVASGVSGTGLALATRGYSHTAESKVTVVRRTVQRTYTKHIKSKQSLLVPCGRGKKYGANGKKRSRKKDADSEKSSVVTAAKL